MTTPDPRDGAVDVDTWWRRLGSSALVGTARRPAPSVAGLALGGGSVAARAGGRPEDAALDAAALGGALRRAGRLTSADPVAVPSAPPEQVDEAPTRARQLLDLLLTQPPTDTATTEVLLIHWCTTCRTSGLRVPHRLLPALLDRAASEELRRHVSVVVGERGRWLAKQNPAWSWFESSHGLQTALDHIDEEFGPAARAKRAAAASARDRSQVDPDEWARSGLDQRARQLRGLRAEDPAAGRDLLLTTWARDSANDRKALLQTLGADLAPEDEELLDSALDDRAGSVRDLAADLLDGLPGSRRAARMAERLRPLVTEAGMLRRQLEVRLPDEPDASGRRDGLGKPPAGRSARGWWLERIVAGAPFDLWGGPADTVVPRVRDQDALAGLRRAAVARRAADWAQALLDVRIDAGLLAVLPREARERRVVDELSRAPLATVLTLLQSVGLNWSPQLSAAVVGRLTRLKPEEAGRLLDTVMPRLVRAVHEDAVPALARWRARTVLLPRHDDQLGSLIHSRTLKHTISEAFQT